jgi:TorA maturation chaperone TorD
MSTEANGTTEKGLGSILSRAHRFQTLAALFSYPESGETAAVRQSLEPLRRAGNRGLGQAERAAIEAVYESWGKADDGPLQEEYTRLFMGRTPCSLYSATYSARNSLVGPAAEIADVSGFYQAFAIDIRDDQPERPDHLAVELEFYGTLLIKLAYAQLNDWQEAREVTAAAARSFLADHLGRWSGVLSERLRQQQAAAPFHSLALWLDTLLDDECRRLGVDPEPFGEPTGDVEPGESMYCPHDAAAAAPERAQPVHFYRPRH